MSVLALSFLGTFDGTLDREPLSSFRSNKARALLTYLTVEVKQAHPRAQICTLFWPESSNAQAQNSLRVALRQLRIAIKDQEAEPPFLQVNRQTIQRNDSAEIHIDVEQFEELANQHDSASRRQAIALYQGDFLMGQSFPDCPEFEAWLLLKREYYTRMALTLLDEETSYCLTSELLEDAQSFARRQLELDEWRESAHRQLIQALAANGERNAALTQYERCQHLLWEDLGVEPEDATKELYESIRRAQTQSQHQTTSTAKFSGKPTTAQSPEQPTPLPQAPSLIFQDRGEMPAIESVYGREAEVEQLIDWIEMENVRLVAILGIGGQGKTTLAATYVRSLLDQPEQQPFDYVIWRSLLNAPPLMEVLQSWLGILVDESETEMPQSLDDSLGLLFQFLRDQRVLLILDNVESILASGETAGNYLSGYDDYAQLLERMGGSEHQSCLLMTSRERPPRIARMERRAPAVRTLPLDGLSADATAELLESLSLTPEENGWHELVDRYSGNPLALLMVADTIDGLFDGDIDAFLTEAFHTDEGLIFDDVRDVLNEQFARLTELERSILIWIAIERGSITTAELRKKILQIGSQRTFLEALRSLQRRSLLVHRQGDRESRNGKSNDRTSSDGISKDGQSKDGQSKDGQSNGSNKLAQPSDMITMQNVIIEFTTDLLIESICNEFTAQEYILLCSHGLLNAQSKEYVRNSQQRLILAPLAQRLVDTIGLDELFQRIHHNLSSLREDETKRRSYAAGNLLNLILQIGLPVDKLNFSGFAIRHAFLRGHSLRNVNFSQAEFIASVFTDTFSNARQVAFSPNGNFLAAATSGNGEIRLWDGSGQEPIANLLGHTKVVYAIGWHQASRTLASGGEDGTVRIWEQKALRSVDSQSGGQWHGRMLYGSNDIVRTVAFRPHPEEEKDLILATAGDDPKIRLWSILSGATVTQLEGHSDVVTALSFSPDGSLLASCSADGSIRVWFVGGVGSASLAVVERGDTSVDGTSVDGTSVDGTSVDGTSVDSTNSDGRILLQLPADAMAVWTVGFSPDGARLAAGSLDGTIWFWSVQQLLGENWSTAQPVLPILTLKEHQQSVQQIAFSPNGQTLASGGDDRLIRLWDVETGGLVNTLQGHTDCVLTVAFRPDGQMLASGSLDETLRLWDAQTGFLDQTMTAYSKPFNSVVFGSTTGLLLTASGDNNVRIWHTKELEPIEGEAPQSSELLSFQCSHVLTAHQGMIWDIAISPDDHLAASVSEDLTLALWDLKHGTLRGQLTGHGHIITAVAFSPNGKLVASGSIDQICRLWDAYTGDCIATLDDGSGSYNVHNAIWAVAFSPDGQSVAAGFGQGDILIWDAASGEIQKVLQSHKEWVRGLAFSPDGETLFSSSNDHSIRIWSLDRGQVIQQLDGHTDWVMTLALSADGTMLASAGHDQTIRLWQINDNRQATELATLTDHAGTVLAVDFSRDGRYLASASVDETTKLWDMETHTAIRDIRTAGPYEGSNISGATGLTDAQRVALRKLGAVE